MINQSQNNLNQRHFEISHQQKKTWIYLKKAERSDKKLKEIFAVEIS